jgi:hypothetical protein
LKSSHWLRGSAQSTFDLDICYDRRPENLRRLGAAVLPFKPALRSAPDGLPFRLDSETIASGLNFTLTTTAGWLDLLGEVGGLGTYQVVADLLDSWRLERSDARQANEIALRSCVLSASA